MEGSEDVSFLNNTVCGPWLERERLVYFTICKVYSVYM